MRCSSRSRNRQTDGTSAPRPRPSQDDLAELAPDHDMFACGVDSAAVRGWMGGFTAAGRPFYIWVAMGSAVSEAKQAEVWRVIDTFTPLAPADEASTSELPHFAPSGTISLANVPEGVTGHTVAGYEVILSRNSDEIHAFLTGTPRAAAMGDSLLLVRVDRHHRRASGLGEPLLPRRGERSAAAPATLTASTSRPSVTDVRLDLSDVTVSGATEPTTDIAHRRRGRRVGHQPARSLVLRVRRRSWPASLTSSHQCDLLEILRTTRRWGQRRPHHMGRLPERTV